MAGFQAIKLLYTRIMGSPDFSEEKIKNLEELNGVLAAGDEVLLGTFWKLLLMPLVGLLDNVFSEKNSISARQKGVEQRVCRASLLCLDVILARCKLSVGGQVHVLLPRFSRFLELFQASDEEDLSLVTLSCLRSIIGGVEECSDPKCDCAERHPEGTNKTPICGLALLQSPSLAIPFGHFLSLLLQIAEKEAKAGSGGNRQLRENSLFLLRLVINKVAKADSLSYFLPGVISGLFKAIMSPSRTLKNFKATSGLPISSWNSTGAGGSSKSVSEALLGLRDFLRVTMGDRNFQESCQDENINDILDGTLTLQALSKLTLNSGENSVPPSSPGETLESFKKKNFPRERSISGEELRVERTPHWRAEVAGRIHSFLEECFSLLREKAPDSVQFSLVEFCEGLLTHCSSSLSHSSPLILETVLILSESPTSEVSKRAQHFLSRCSISPSITSQKLRGSPKAISMGLPLLHSLFLKAISKLNSLMGHQNQSSASLASRQLVGILRLAGPLNTPSLMIISPEVFPPLLEGLLHSLQFSPGPALLQEITTGERRPPLALQDSPESPLNPPRILPEMPARLAHAPSPQLYKDLLRVPQTLGYLAAQDPQGTSLHSIFQRFLELLEAENSDGLNERQMEKENEKDRSESQRRSASIFLVLGHFLFGAIQSSPKLPLPHLSDLSKLTLRAAAECSSPSILSLPTSPKNPLITSPIFSYSSTLSDLTLGIINDNALLQEMALECLARMILAISHCWDSPPPSLSPRLFLVCLRPLLQSLASDHPLVSVASKRALWAFCALFHCNSVGELVRQNVDHVADVVCSGLRHLDVHPYSPQLLLAVLRHSGAGRDVLPLLSEPIRSVVKSVKVIGRQRLPQHTLTFTKSMSFLAQALEPEAKSLAVETQREVGGPFEKISSFNGEKLASFKAMAVLMADCFDAFTPLLESQDLQVQLAALDALEAGLGVLSQLQAVREWRRREVERAMEDVKEEEVPPNFEDEGDFRDSGSTSELLPRVHLLWPHLMACLRSPRLPTVVRAVEVVQKVVEFGGGSFMSRRVREDLWPLMAQFLREGSPSPRQDFTSLTKNPLLMAPESGPRHWRHKLEFVQGQKDLETSEKSLVPNRSTSEIAPLSQVKLQRAVLMCLRKLAECKDTKKAMIAILRPLLSRAVILLTNDTLREESRNLLKALGEIDPDLVWLIMADFVGGKPNDKRFSPLAEVGIQPWKKTEDSLVSQWQGKVGLKLTNEIPVGFLVSLMSEIANIDRTSEDLGS